MCGLAIIKETGVLFGWLVFTPEGRMGVQVTRSLRERANTNVTESEGKWFPLLAQRIIYELSHMLGERFVKWRVVAFSDTLESYPFFNQGEKASSTVGRSKRMEF